MTLKTDHQASKCLILALRASTGYEVQNTSISKSGQYPSSLISLGQVKIAILIVADCVSVCVCMRAHMHTKSCLTLCDSMDCRLPGSSVHGIFQARILEHSRFPSEGNFISWVPVTPNKMQLQPQTTYKVQLAIHCHSLQKIWPLSEHSQVGLFSLDACCFLLPTTEVYAHLKSTNQHGLLFNDSQQRQPIHDLTHTALVMSTFPLGSYVTHVLMK